MYKARYYKADGKKGKARALPDSLFDGVVNEGVMHQVVKAYLSNQRQGTAAAKSRGQVSGGGRKPFRQKGTGRARQGTTRAVQMAGGGVAFPPIPHGWRQRVPKKVKSLARRSAFNARAEGDRVILVDMPTLEKPRTKDVLAFLAAVGAEGKTLILTDGKNDNVHLSARNLPGVQVLPFGEESVYDVLWAGSVIIERGALDALAGESGAKAAKKAKTAAPEAAAPEAAAPEAAAPEAAAPEAAEPEAAAPEAESETEETKEGDDA